MSPIALVDTIYGSHYTISANFYLYLQYFQQKVFSLSKISEFQTDPKSIWQETFLITIFVYLLTLFSWYKYNQFLVSRQIIF